MGLQRVGHEWATELSGTELNWMCPSRDIVIYIKLSCSHQVFGSVALNKSWNQRGPLKFHYNMEVVHLELSMTSAKNGKFVIQTRLPRLHVQHNFYFIFIYFFLLYNTVLVLPYIDMNLPWVYVSSQSWTPSHHPPHIISLGLPSAPAPSIPYPASNLDWRFASCMIVYMSQCWINISPSAHFYSHMVTYYNQGTEAENKVRSFLWSRCLVQVSTTENVLQLVIHFG